MTLQSMFDAALPPGTDLPQANNIGGLSDEVIQAIHAETSGMPPGRSMVFVVQMGEAVARVDEEATAFGGRSAPFQTLSSESGTSRSEGTTVKWVRGFSVRARTMHSWGVKSTSRTIKTSRRSG